MVIFLLRRRHRRKRRNSTHESFRWPPADPNISFSDLPEAPPMRTIEIDIRRKPSVVWGPRPTSTDENMLTAPTPPPAAYTPKEMSGIGLAGVSASGSPYNSDTTGPFGDLHAVPELYESTTGLAVTTGQDVVRRRSHSVAPSSPSMYSMKTANEDRDSLWEHEMSLEDPFESSQERSLTPPTSVSSSSTHKPNVPLLLVSPLKPTRAGGAGDPHFNRHLV